MAPVHRPGARAACAKQPVNPCRATRQKRRTEMFERLNTPEEAYNYKLGSALTMEREIVEMLDGLIEKANDETLRQLLRVHQEETRGHVTNIEQVFAAFGWEVDDSPCVVIDAIEKEGKATIRKADDALADSIILSGAMETEHHEIAVYEYLIGNARAMGRQDAVELLQRNLEQEERALENVRTLAVKVATASQRQTATANERA
jgi:ferritin-like metal-binding protein YciE